MITPTKVDFSSISEVVVGSGVTPEHINAPLQASAYAQELATNQPDVSEANNVGTPSVEIIETNGTPQFKFKNIKGVIGSIIYHTDLMMDGYEDYATNPNLQYIYTTNVDYSTYERAPRVGDYIIAQAFTQGGRYSLFKINSIKPNHQAIDSYFCIKITRITGTDGANGADGNGFYIYVGDIPEETSELEKANMFTTPQDRDFIDGDIIISTNGVMVTVSGGTTDTLIYVEYAGKIEPSINAEDLPNMNYIEFGYGENAEETVIQENGIRATYTNTEIEYQDKNGNTAYQTPSATIKVPIVAGENVTFEKDETNQTVKINTKNIISLSYGNTHYADEVVIEDGGIKAIFNTSSEIEYEDKDGNVSYKNPSIVTKIPIEAGENIDFDNDGSIVYISAIPDKNVSNPNILINSNFAINQRGQTVYTTSNQYTVDRWLLNGGKLGVNTDGTISHVVTAVGQGIRQPIENPSRLAGKKVTVSLKGYNKSGRITLGLYVKKSGSSSLTLIGMGQVSIPASESPTEKSGTYTIPTSITDNDILYFTISTATSNTTTVLYWAKLEESERKTAYTTPDLAIELMRCQRYYEKSNIRDICGIAVSTSHITNGSIKYKVTKRTIPTTTVYSSSANTSGYLQQYGSVTNEVKVAIDPATRSENSFYIYSSETFGVGLIYCGYYIADAEIY